MVCAGQWVGAQKKERDPLYAQIVAMTTKRRSAIARPTQ